MSPVDVVLSIDTEEDWHSSGTPSYRNIASLAGFQHVCLDLGLRPTYLATYGVVADGSACVCLKALAQGGQCEIGAHCHPWLTPAAVEPWDGSGRATYLHEYPEEVRIAKLEALTRQIAEPTGVRPTSYRGGRWTMDPVALRTLINLGYIADSTVTPLLSWADFPGYRAGGNDYILAPTHPYHPDPVDICRPGTAPILEIPYTSRAGAFGRAAMRTLGRLGVGRSPALWKWIGRPVSRLTVLQAQPTHRGDAVLAQVARIVSREEPAVLNIAAHSSEVALGGSPWSQTLDQVQAIWGRLRRLVEVLSDLTDWRGVTLSESAAEHAAREAPTNAEPSRSRG